MVRAQSPAQAGTPLALCGRRTSVISALAGRIAILANSGAGRRCRKSDGVMSTIVSFRDLDAWNVGMDLVVAVYDLASRLPQTERYELSAQVRRAVVSIPSNVAEGYAYRGRRFLHHVRIALGSLAELDTQLEAAQRLGLLGPDLIAGIRPQLDRTGQLLHGLLRSLLLRLFKQTAIVAGGLALVVSVLSW